MYLMLSSRPDIAFALNQASQFCENPQAAHWAAVKKIFLYLQGTKNYGLLYGLEPGLDLNLDWTGIWTGLESGLD
jgi:hypothetical protein